MSALHWAAENNHEHTVELLLKSGADRTLINKFGKSAQKLARMKNNTKIYELLEVGGFLRRTFYFFPFFFRF